MLLEREYMDRWILLLIFCMAAPVFLLSGCSITGQTSGVMHDYIISCSLNTQIEMMEVADDVQACYRDNSIYFAVDNTGSTTLSGLSVHLDADYALTMLVRAEAAPGETVQQSLSFGSQKMDGLRSLTIYPLVGGVDNDDLCVEAAITAALHPC